MGNYFVTGTDTGVGKTVVSCLLAVGQGAKYWKPIQSGLDQPTDKQFVEGFLGHKNCLPEVYRLSAPLSPHLSARLDSINIKLEEFCWPLTGPQPLIVEGAGGVLVPLNQKDLIIDLIKKFDLSTIIVARSSLGTINHTLLTIESLRAYGIKIKGVVMNGTKNKENKKAIEHYGKTKVLFELEPIKKMTADFFKEFYQTNVRETII